MRVIFFCKPLDERPGWVYNGLRMDVKVGFDPTLAPDRPGASFHHNVDLSIAGFRAPNSEVLKIGRSFLCLTQICTLIGVQKPRR